MVGEGEGEGEREGKVLEFLSKMVFPFLSALRLLSVQRKIECVEEIIITSECLLMYSTLCSSVLWESGMNMSGPFRKARGWSSSLSLLLYAALGAADESWLVASMRNC